jgi:hypothetical protein
MTTYDLIDVQNLVVEYADFEETNSVARAKLFVTNAKRWLILQPESASNQSSSMSMSKSVIHDLLKRAEKFIEANDTSNNGTVRFLGVGNFFRG